jgi:hypothetical protein
MRRPAAVFLSVRVESGSFVVLEHCRFGRSPPDEREANDTSTATARFANDIHVRCAPSTLYRNQSLWVGLSVSDATGQICAVLPQLTARARRTGYPFSRLRLSETASRNRTGGNLSDAGKIERVASAWAAVRIVSGCSWRYRK